MTAVVESKMMTERDFLNIELLNDLRRNVENGNDLHILAASNDSLIPMWPLTEEDFPEEVLLEVEVISSWEDEMPGSGVIDIDLASRSTYSGTLSNYTCGSAVGYKSNMDHSHGSLDLSPTGPYANRQHETTPTTLNYIQNISPPPPTFTTVQSSIPNMSHSQNHIPNVCRLDLSQTSSNYLQYSGNTSNNLHTNQNAQNNSLIDPSTSGVFYQLPMIKLKPGFGIAPAITYKQEADYNHNESVSSSIQNVIEPVAEYHVKQEEHLGDNGDDTYDNVSCVTVEGVESSRVPLTVASQDDDNDSGTESFDSKDSDSSLKLDMLGDGMNDTNAKGDKKRPGRKKGQVSKVYHLWEFIRDILNDPKHSGKVIKWEDEEEGIFRVVQSEVAATMWGAKKNNRTKMTYEKMSRSIRYSRKEGYFDDLPKDKGYPKKLCFKFGQKAHGWNLKKRMGCRQ